MGSALKKVDQHVRYHRLCGLFSANRETFSVFFHLAKKVEGGVFWLIPF